MRIVYVLMMCLVLVGGCKGVSHQLIGQTMEIQQELEDQGRGHANIVSGIYEFDFDYERANGLITINGLMSCLEGENISTSYTIFKINVCFTDANGVVQVVYPISYRSSGLSISACDERTFSRRFRDDANYKGIILGWEGEESNINK